MDCISSIFDPGKIKVSKKVSDKMQTMVEDKLLDVENASLPDTSTQQFALLNVRSLRRHFTDVIKDPALLGVDFLALTETWLQSSDQTAKYDIDGYKLIRADRCDGRKTHGGGVAVYLKNEYEYNTEVLSKYGVECLSVVLRRANSEEYAVKLFVLYRAPDIHTDSLLSLLQDIMQPASNADWANVQTIIIGDFNIDIATGKESECQRLLCGQGWFQLVTQPTCISGSLLDHVYIRSVDLNAKLPLVVNVDCYYSDHDIIKMYY